MRISVRRPNFKKDFMNCITIAQRKGADCLMLKNGERFEGTVYAPSGRMVGDFTFMQNKEEDKLTQEIILTRFHIIEKDYFPLHFCIYSLVQFLKRRKIKYISVKNDILLT